MGSAALDFKNIQDMQEQFLPLPEEEELNALLKFCESPKYVGGLDNLKESLRNIITHMMAMKGLDVGYRFPHFLDDSYVGLSSTDSNTERVRKKKKKQQQLWDYLLELDRIMVENFSKLQEHTYERIQYVKTYIKEQIQTYNKMIELSKDDGFLPPEELQEAKQKLTELKELQTDVIALEDELKTAHHAAEIISVEKKLEDRLESFPEKSKQSEDFFEFVKNPPKNNTNPFAKAKTDTRRNKRGFSDMDSSADDSSAAEAADVAEASAADFAESAAETEFEASAETAEDHSTESTAESPEVDAAETSEVEFESAPSDATAESAAGFSEADVGAESGDEAEDTAEDTAEVDDTPADTAAEVSHDTSFSESDDDDASDDDFGDDDEDEDDNLEPPDLNTP